MARFTNPSTWGRSKPKASAPNMSTADLNQSSAYRDPYAQPSSSYAAGSGTHHHPYASNPSSAPPVIAHDVSDMDENCPVCLESLAFSFRLPGEKPHVVPECGHALHEVSNNEQKGSLLLRSVPEERGVSLFAWIRDRSETRAGASSHCDRHRHRSLFLLAFLIPPPRCGSRN